MWQGVYTVPLIFVLQENNIQLKELINKKENLIESDAKKIQQLVLGLDDLKKAKHLAEKHTQKAMKWIDQLPEQLEKEQLKKLRYLW